MKAMIKFSLKRRFANSSTIILNLMLFVMIGAVFFSDHIIDMINPDMLKPGVIYVENVDEEWIDKLNEIEQETFKFKKKTKNSKLDSTHYYLSFKDNFVLTSFYEVDAPLKLALEQMLTSVKQQMILEEQFSNSNLLLEYETPIVVDTKIKHKSVDVSSDKKSLITMVLTSIYFMMLSFASGVANEVINEKATKTLELILTSISAKTHFLSKMLAGWLMIFIQCISVLSYIVFWFIVRNGMDHGSGLMKMVYKLGFISEDIKSFQALFHSFEFTSSFIILVVLILLFLFMGILFVQVILVVVSSFITSVEEASNIQAPFYFVLVCVYYLSISINTPYHMSEGIGYYLSFLPFFSMLFMPSRLLLMKVNIYEILFALLINGISIYFVIKYGSKAYEKGVLDYSRTGFVSYYLKKLKNR